MLVSIEIAALAAVIIYGGGVIELKQKAFPLLIDVNYRKSRVSNAPDLANGQGRHDGSDTFVHIDTVRHHSTKYFRR